MRDFDFNIAVQKRIVDQSEIIVLILMDDSGNELGIVKLDYDNLFSVTPIEGNTEVELKDMGLLLNIIWQLPRKSPVFTVLKDAMKGAYSEALEDSITKVTVRVFNPLYYSF